MDFLETIFERLRKGPDTVLLQELSGGESVSVTGADLTALIQKARAFLGAQGFKKGERIGLLAANSIRWVAMDLAIIAEGLIAVPLYARQAPGELVAMLKDCAPALLCCGNSALRQSIAEHWPGAPRMAVFDDIFATATPGELPAPVVLAAGDPVAIVYTSGTSGEAKGVVLGLDGVDFILSATSQRLDLLMRGQQGQERVFHYPPFCFAASWIMLLTCLERGNLLMMAMDLGTLAADMRAAAPNYFLNVPVLLERMRTAIDEQLRKTGGLANLVYTRAREAWLARGRGERTALGEMWLALARVMIFPTIRKKMIGANLKALICGSAPLARETQLFFMMLGIPVLQVYGLTETTAICTMDDPRDVEPGRVGPAIPGIEMKLGENDEILVRGPNLFQGYWKREQATAEVMREGWFRTGDQGEVNERGKWRISGRIKNLIVLSSGHNVAPEPIEDEMLRLLPDAQQVVLVGHGRPFVAAMVTGGPTPEQVQFAMDEVNRELPHYKRVRAYYIHPEPFTVESGMVTVNGKLKRDVIASRLREQVEKLYAKQEVRAG
ncbi:MAG TPA: AMP-binding protein [Terriglobales bacterium]|nr:AMP-binding protein [Terriglobales bacterium]